MHGKTREQSFCIGKTRQRLFYSLSNARQRFRADKAQRVCTADKPSPSAK